MTKILVLGKNGYVSNCFQTYMKQFEDYSVDAISVRDNSWKKIDFSIYDSIFNTVGLAHNDARKGTDEEFINLNVNLPVKLASKAKLDGCKQFIHMSSMIVYGSLKPLGKNDKYTVDTIPCPNNIYGKSKMMGEQELFKLQSDYFNVAIIRSPLIYGEKAIDNFAKLVSYSGKLPIFPNIKNERSMIYSDNLCELVRLIVENNSFGLFYPQQEKYICTSELVKDIANGLGNKIIITSFFNPVLYMLSGKLGIVDKVFGTEAYESSMSEQFDGRYRIVSYVESIKRIISSKKVF